MMNPFTPLKPFVLSFAICSLLCASLVAQQRTTPDAQSLPDTHSPSVECFRPLTTDISGDRVTTEILNACHDNAISIRFQLMSDSLPKPVEMLGDFTISMAIASMPETNRKKNADTGYWLVGETRKLTLHYPGTPIPSTDRVGDQIMVTAALFQAGTYAGDPHALDTIKAHWIEFQSDYEKLQEFFNAPEVKQAAGSREKLIRFSEQRSRTTPHPDQRPEGTRIQVSGDDTRESSIVRSLTNLPTLHLLTDEQSDKALFILQQIVARQLAEYKRLSQVFDVPSLGEGEAKQ
jgi:hypothetical protein